MEPKDGFVEANGIRLHYTEWGGDAPPLVLLHATGFLARLWQPIAVQLSARFHVYALDARGHGDSDKPAPAGGYGWEGLAADLRGFLDALGLVGVPIVGHSSGAAGAIRLAARRPEYVAAAVLIEPTVFPPMPVEGSDERKEQLASGAAKRRMVWDSREEFIEGYRLRRTFAGWHEDVLRLYAEHGTFKREDGRLADFFQGIIKAAAAFHHLLRGNHKGAVTLLGDALTLLAPYRPACLGVDVQRLIDEASACYERVRGLGPKRIGEFDRSTLPRIAMEGL